MFKPVSSHFNPVLHEEQTLNFWKLRRLFAKSSALNQGSAEFVFYEDPPSANRKPDVLDALERAYQDVFPRYKGMRGYHVTRHGGWHTQGLPAEIALEKQAGISGKAQIEAFGIERFNDRCRKSAFAFIQEWERFSDRIAYWGDMQNAFVSHTNEYIESVWWILKTLWDRDLLYQAYKVLPYCPRCGTPLSDREVIFDEAVGRGSSAYVRLPLVDEPGTSLLVWTPRPWTLTGNVAVAAQPETEYVTVRRGLPEGGSEKLILARGALEQAFAGQPVAVVEAYKGRKLKGRRYSPLFTFMLAGKQAYRVVMQGSVSGADGTGLAGIAPAYGAEDLQAALDHDLPILTTVTEEGTLIPEIRPWSGLPVQEAEPHILRDLQARGLLLREEREAQASPACLHCHAPLIDLARTTWFLRTSAFTERLEKLHRQVGWIPAHARPGWFKGKLEKPLDWPIARERYWGTPLPVWECQGCRHQVAIGSIAELSQLSQRDLNAMDLHRPYIDEVHFNCPKCSGVMRRLSEVLDFWFDAGAMPMAQWHFPYADRAAFRGQFPADLICEPGEEAQGWFYALHTIAALLFDSLAYKNVLCLGPALDADGQRLARSAAKGLDPWEGLNSHGSDAFRWYLYTAASAGQEHRCSRELAAGALGSFILPLWEAYSFFVTQANLDHWSPAEVATEETAGERPEDPQPGAGLGTELVALDHWLRSELHALINEVTLSLESYDVTSAARRIQAFVSDLTHWYLRRARRLFWTSAATPEKAHAYNILYEALVALCKLLAPMAPFIAEVLYQNLVRTQDALAPESVHLCAWPGYAPEAIDETCLQEMRRVRLLASLGHSARSQAGIKPHQPLRKIEFANIYKEGTEALKKYSGLLADELNVKQVGWLDSPDEVLTYTLRPRASLLEQKYPDLYPELSLAIQELDPAASASRLEEGAPLAVQVAGQQLMIQPEEVELVRTARHGLAAAFEGSSVAALDLEITPDLKLEAQAGEFIGHLLELRRQAGFGTCEWIRIVVSATPGLWQAIQDHREVVLGETRAVELSQGGIPEGAVTAEAWFDGEWMKAGILRQEVPSAESRPEAS